MAGIIGVALVNRMSANMHVLVALATPTKPIRLVTYCTKKESPPMVLALLSLPADHVDVWYADVAGGKDDSDLLGWLTDAERARRLRYAFAKDRNTYATARALVRTTLSRYFAIAPHEWRFSTGAHGRPEIDHCHGKAIALRFNISHNEHCVVLAVTAGREIGIDVESLSRDPALDVAASFFAPAEVATLEKLPPEAQPRRFWELWTFKESYMKARGLGLSLPLDAFAVRLDIEGAVELVLAPQAGDRAERWHLAQAIVDGGQLVALCVEHKGATSPQFHFLRSVPGNPASDVALRTTITRQSPRGL